MRRRHAAALVLGGAIALGGCAANLARLAPPAETLATPGAGDAGSNVAQLARGRAVYLDQCARCHAPIAVDRYGAARWEEILPDMVARTKLDEGPAADVAAYVRAAVAAASP